MISNGLLQPKQFYHSVIVSCFANHSLFDDTDIFCELFRLYTQEFHMHTRFTSYVVYFCVLLHWPQPDKALPCH